MIGNGNLSYWRAVLDEDQGTDGFPEKHIRTVKSRASRRKAEIKLSISCGEKLLSMGKGRLPNLFILLLTGGSILLSKRSFSKDISYAVPLLLSARGMGRKNRVVLLRLRMRAEQSFRELSKETAEVYQNALKHQDIAEEELPLPRDTHMPLVRTIFSMEGLHDAEGASGIYPDILFLFRLRDGSISIEADYVSSCGSPKTRALLFPSWTFFPRRRNDFFPPFRGREFRCQRKRMQSALFASPPNAIRISGHWCRAEKP